MHRGRPESQFLERLRLDRPADADAEDILLQDGARLTAGIEEIIVGIERVVAEELIGVSVKLAGSGLKNGIDISAAVAALTGVVKRSLHLKFLDDVGIRKRRVGQFRDVVVGGRDAFYQIIVIVFALAVYDDADIAPAQSR